MMQLRYSIFLLVFSIIGTVYSAGIESILSLKRIDSTLATDFNVICGENLKGGRVTAIEVKNGKVCNEPDPYFQLFHSTDYYSTCPSLGMAELMKKVKHRCITDLNWMNYTVIRRICKNQYHPNPQSLDCRQICEFQGYCNP